MNYNNLIEINENIHDSLNNSFFTIKNNNNIELFYDDKIDIQTTSTISELVTYEPTEMPTMIPIMILTIMPTQIPTQIPTPNNIQNNYYKYVNRSLEKKYIVVISVITPLLFFSIIFIFYKYFKKYYISYIDKTHKKIDINKSFHHKRKTSYKKYNNRSKKHLQNTEENDKNKWGLSIENIGV